MQTATLLNPEPHHVEFYETEDGLYGSVVDYLATGLVSGRALVVIATPEHCAGFRKRLRARHCDVDGALATGALKLLDAGATLAAFMVDGMPDEGRFRSVVGGVLEESLEVGDRQRVRAYGEMVDLLWQDHNPQAAVRLEEMWNELAQDYPFDLMCAYRLDTIRNEPSDLHLRRVYAAHSHVSHSVPTETHFRLLVESVKDYAIYMLDCGGRIVSWNRGAERLKGYSAEEMIGQHCSRLFLDEDVRAGVCERELELALRNGRFEGEGRRQRKDGSSFWVGVVITPVYGEDQRHIGFANVTRDLTERKSAADELQHQQSALARERVAREEAEQQARVSELFVAVLGHDLRNPLGAIMTAAYLISHSATEERQRRAAARIISSSERMTRMIDQLLDFTRIRLGSGLTLAPTETNLEELARQLVEETEAAHSRSIRFQRRGDAFGWWDRDRLAQVLSNLLANAAQYGGPDRPVVVELDGDHPAHVNIEVRNSGHIPAAVVPTLFQPFRGEGTRGGSRGLGIGLYITREVVRAHGGLIAVSSTESDGTVFHVHLPRRAVV